MYKEILFNQINNSIFYLLYLKLPNVCLKKLTKAGLWFYFFKIHNFCAKMSPFYGKRQDKESFIIRYYKQ